MVKMVEVKDNINKKFKPLEHKVSEISEDVDKIKDANYQLIRNTVMENITVSSLQNEYLDYENLTKILYKLIFEEHVDPSILSQNSKYTYIILSESPKPNLTFNPKIMNELEGWLNNTLLPKISSNKQKNDHLELIDKATSFHADSANEIQFIDIEQLGNILQDLTFEEKYSITDLVQPEVIEGMIQSSIVYGHEYKLKDREFIKSLSRWLHFHVIPYIFEHKKEYESEQSMYSDEIAEERNYNGALEHRHASNYYWHPATRVHANIETKYKLPKGHVIKEQSTEKSFSEKLKEKGVKLPRHSPIEELSSKKKMQKSQEQLYNDKYQLIENLIIKEVNEGGTASLFSPMDLNEILYVLIGAKNLSLNDIVLNPVHIETIMDSSLEDPEELSGFDKKVISGWLRKRFIPKIFTELGIQQKPKYELISKSKIVDCIYPLNLNYISNETFDYYLSSNIESHIDVIYSYINDNKLSLNELKSALHPELDIYKQLYIDPEISQHVKDLIIQWLDRAVIKCIIKKIEESSKIEELSSELFSGTPENHKEPINLIKSTIEPYIHYAYDSIQYVNRSKLYSHIFYNFYKPNKIINQYDDIDTLYDDITSSKVIPPKSEDQIKSWLLNWIIPSINLMIGEKIQESEQISIQEFKQITNFTIDETSPLYKRIDTIVRSFYDSFYNTDSLCLYYTYYILKLKGNTDFDYEFKQLEDKLYNDFYNYGIFAIMGELKHLLDNFYVTYDNQGYNLIDFIKGTTKIEFGFGFKRFMNNLSKCTILQIEDIYKIIKIYQIYKYTHSRSYEELPPYEKETHILKDVAFLYLIEKYFGYYTRPEFILRIAIKSFNILPHNQKMCHWASQYGGYSWASIAKVMSSRDFIASKTIFVDTCWSLQHNTELFINKVYNQAEDIQDMKNYLTQIKDGIFRVVYQCAIKNNPKLDRFIYRNIILENDASIPEDKHENWKSEKWNVKQRIRRTIPPPDIDLIDEDGLPEKEDMDISSYSDEDKYKLYKEIDNDFGLKDAKINIQPFVKDNPHVEIIIYASPYKYITDLDSIMNYLNKKYPLGKFSDYAYQKTENEIRLIKDTIINNVDNLENSEMSNIINHTVDYFYLAYNLNDWIYKLNHTTENVISNLDILVRDSLQHPADYDDKEKMKLLKLWIKDYLIPDLEKSNVFVKPVKRIPEGLSALFG